MREPDGLALSSRNLLLAPEHRREAIALVRALDAAQAAVAAGERSSARLLALVALELEKAPHGGVDYAELRDPETLEPAPSRLTAETLLALAMRFPTLGDAAGSVRLIDNRVLHPCAEEKS